MKHAYGDWTNYDAIVQNGGFTLQQALQCGGSHVRKSQMVMKILHQVKAAHGTYSLNHLLHVEDDDATKELLSYNGVGPKTASCILALTLHRSRFVVDTHIHRITGILGWRPKEATQNKLALILNMKFPISTNANIPLPQPTNNHNFTPPSTSIPTPTPQDAVASAAVDSITASALSSPGLASCLRTVTTPSTAQTRRAAYQGSRIKDQRIARNHLAQRYGVRAEM
ncbi:DNA glycosylase [Aspergillus affinis]|uniref:DNA glycosylase n=1 Tax=Aspergillus affinis TaxID=1070780 RepID=UPI0022FE9058|nr:DNA glycosylase [Aspergillus affinis]KAI9040844.1 DNA glycosylase [Aspergillus affinis]